MLQTRHQVRSEGQVVTNQEYWLSTIEACQGNTTSNIRLPHSLYETDLDNNHIRRKKNHIFFPFGNIERKEKKRWNIRVRNWFRCQSHNLAMHVVVYNRWVTQRWHSSCTWSTDEFIPLTQVCTYSLSPLIRVDCTRSL